MTSPSAVMVPRLQDSGEDGNRRTAGRRPPPSPETPLRWCTSTTDRSPFRNGGDVLHACLDLRTTAPFGPFPPVLARRRLGARWRPCSGSHDGLSAAAPVTCRATCRPRLGWRVPQ